MCRNCCPERYETEEKLTNEVSGLSRTVRKLSAENAALARELKKLHGDSPKAEEIRAVGAYWRHFRPRCKFPEGEKRWKTVERALRHFTVDELLEAVDGAMLKPFVRYGRRIAEAVPGCGRKDDLADVLRDETTIEECREIARRAKASRVEKLHTVWVSTGQVHDAWSRLLMDALCANGSHG